MSYLALYRRYRPKRWEDFIGQEAVIKTLVNQIKTGNIGHAYIFAGARGTGKTSAAKIMARAVNCLAPENGSPCGKCDVCKALSEDNIDVLEIDAASNNKVDEARELIEKVGYPPTFGKYKVFIIDEVHMLTDQAFNALLKTIEEPPEYAIFILATTEPQKLPATILSRCMRFDFRLVSTLEIARLVAKIYDEVGKSYDEEAVSLIAAGGDGSVRDALSLADVCLSFSDGKLSYYDVLTVMGATDREVTFALADSILDGDGGRAIKLLSDILLSGKNVNVLAKDLTSHFRELLVVKLCKDAQSVLSVPLDRLVKLKTQAEKGDEHRLLRIVEIYSQLESALRYSSQARILLEAVTVKASTPQLDGDILSLLSRVKALEAGGGSSAVKLKSGTEDRIKTAVDGEKIWGVFLQTLRNDGEVVLWALLQNLKHSFDGMQITVIPRDENETKLLSREEQQEKMNKSVQKIGAYKIVLSKIEDKKDVTELAAERAKKVFDDTRVEIK